jgi:hypothetical protein
MSKATWFVWLDPVSTYSGMLSLWSTVPFHPSRWTPHTVKTSAKAVHGGLITNLITSRRLFPLSRSTDYISFALAHFFILFSFSILSKSLLLMFFDMFFFIFCSYFGRSKFFCITISQVSFLKRFVWKVFDKTFWLWFCSKSFFQILFFVFPYFFG